MLKVTRREQVVTEHKGYKLVQYIDDMFGETFCNAEVYKDGKLQAHATTREIMHGERAKAYIENHIEVMERIFNNGNKN